MGTLSTMGTPFFFRLSNEKIMFRFIFIIWCINFNTQNYTHYLRYAMIFGNISWNYYLVIFIDIEWDDSLWLYDKVLEKVPISPLKPSDNEETKADKHRKINVLRCFLFPLSDNEKTSKSQVWIEHRYRIVTGKYETVSVTISFISHSSVAYCLSTSSS